MCGVFSLEKQLLTCEFQGKVVSLSLRKEFCILRSSSGEIIAPTTSSPDKSSFQQLWCTMDKKGCHISFFETQIKMGKDLSECFILYIFYILSQTWIAVLELLTSWHIFCLKILIRTYIIVLKFVFLSYFFILYFVIAILICCFLGGHIFGLRICLKTYINSFFYFKFIIIKLIFTFDFCRIYYFMC